MTVRTRLATVIHVAIHVAILASLICLAARAALLATANVMAPLDLDAAPPGAFDAFKAQLKIAKSMGVDAVSVDVWWGEVERAADNTFDWSYYDKLLAAIEAAGLHWVPIMSFHQCGGNVGDSCNIPAAPSGIRRSA
jgi:beta-amylase